MTLWQRIVARLKAKRYLMTDRTKLFLWQMDGKKYLAVHVTGLRGLKWARTFEVVDEVNEELNPLGTQFPIPHKHQDKD